MHNQSDIHFKAQLNTLVDSILYESDIPVKKNIRNKINDTKAKSLADAGDTPAIKSSREQALTGGCRPSSHYFPATGTKD